MTIISLIENNTMCYGVTFQNNGNIKIQKLEDISADKINIYCVKPLEVIMGKSQVCDMTIFSVPLDKSVFDGNTTLLKLRGENNKHRYVYIGGDMVCSFLTNDKIYNMSQIWIHNLTPYSIAIGMENIYLLTPYFKFINKEKRNEDDLFESYDYLISKCRKDSFKKLRMYKIHSNYDNLFQRN